MVKVGSGWTPPEDYFKGDDGTYPVTLTRIGVEDREGSFTAWATRSYEGQFGSKTVQDWRFALEDGTVIDAAVGVPKVKNGETEVHPKSTYYGYVCALTGKRWEENADLPSQDQLIGREALATINRDDKGYSRITTLGSLPTKMTSAQPTAAPPAAAATAAEQSPDALPF